MKQFGAIAAAIALAAGLAGCGTPAPMSTFTPHSDFARDIFLLYWQVIGWDTLVLATVAVTLFLALFKFSTRTEQPEAPARPHVQLALEVAWTAGPALILLAIAIPSIRLSFSSQPSKPPPGGLEVKVIAHQWWWEIQYPTLHVTTANEVHIPAGRLIHFELQSADVIHSFWCPELGGKRDVIPGHTNELVLQALAPGTYWGQCGEFCGMSHANMRLRVMADKPEQFERWVDWQKARAVVPVSDPAALGAKIFASSPCTTCHTIRGASSGIIAPDLTHFGSRTTLAAGVLNNNPQTLAAWLEDPARFKPGVHMPALGLGEAQARELAAYLEALK